MTEIGIDPEKKAVSRNDRYGHDGRQGEQRGNAPAEARDSSNLTKIWALKVSDSTARSNGPGFPPKNQLSGLKGWNSIGKDIGNFDDFLI